MNCYKIIVSIDFSAMSSKRFSSFDDSSSLSEHLNAFETTSVFIILQVMRIHIVIY